jgi:cell division protein FtsB
VGVDVATVVSVISVLVAVLSWFTSARKSRVDSLCQIIDALGEEIARLRERVLELERENRLLRQVLERLGFDPDAEIEEILADG